MDALDFLLLPVYFGIFYLLALQIAARNRSNPLYSMYYMRGINYKFIGALGFAFIYLFYYKGGDSINFYYTVSPLFKLFFTNPTAYCTFVFSNNPWYPAECVMEVCRHQAYYLLRGTPTLTTIRVASVLDMFCFDSYFALTLCFAFISYQFQWRMFLLFTSIYPKLHKRFAMAFLMIPSVLFWGSGLSKDSIMIGAIMFFIYCYYNLVIRKRNILKYLPLLVVTGFLITLIRGFILFTIVPCLFLMTVTYYRNAIGSSFLRFLIGPVMIISAVGGSLLFLRGVGSEVQSYSIESLQTKAEGFKSWHQYLGETQGGSSYSLGGDVSYTGGGILRQAPMAILVTLYGPFPWQIRSPVMLLSGIESLIFVYITLTMLSNKRIYSLISILAKDHIIAFCVPFALILGVAIGMTSFNYGALVRYRIPILPFFASALIIINYHLNNQQVKPN